MGFGVPIDAWLRGPLRGWADDLLDPAAMVRAGFLDRADQVKWDGHLSDGAIGSTSCGTC